MKRDREKGFTLVELMCVLVILALLALLVGKAITGSINQAKDDLDESKKKAILNAAEKWSIDNSDKFDDFETKKIKVGLDVVFIVDMSGSMKGKMNDGNAKTAATVNSINIALDTLREYEDNRVGFVLFSGRDAGGGSSGNNPYRSANTSILHSSNKLIPINQIGTLVHSTNGSQEYVTIPGDTNSPIEFVGGTYTMLGLQKATQLLMQSDGITKKGRIPVVILVTDGEPSTGVANRDVNESNYLQVTDADQGHGGTTWCLSSAVWPNFKDYFEFPYVSNRCATVTNYPISEATNRSVKMVWNVIQTSVISKKNLSKIYGASMYFYTIGIGLTSDFGKFMLEPNATRLANLSTSRATTGVDSMSKTEEKYWDTLWHVDISEKLYNFINPTDGSPKKTDYNYVTKAFLNSVSLEDLKANFEEIATEISEATKVSEVCVKVRDLQQGGYLGKNIELTEEYLNDKYVIMSYNEPTNQFSYALAETENQIQACQDYYMKQEAKENE